MELTRKVILQSIYDLNYDPKITPNSVKHRKLFKILVQDFVLKHYGVCETDLASQTNFEANVRNFQNRAGKRMGTTNFSGFISCDVNQEWLCEVFPRPKTKEEVDSIPAKTPSGGKRQGRPSTECPPPPPKKGRPSLPFEEMGRSTRSKAIKAIADTHTEAELFEALALKLKRRGFSSAVKTVNFLATDPETNGKKIVDSLSTPGTLILH